MLRTRKERKRGTGGHFESAMARSKIAGCKYSRAFNRVCGSIGINERVSLFREFSTRANVPSDAPIVPAILLTRAALYRRVVALIEARVSHRR